MTRNRDLGAMTVGGRAVRRSLVLRFVIAVVLLVGIVPWSTLATAAQDATPAAGAAQVVGQLPEISVAGKTGGTLNMGISFDAANFRPRADAGQHGALGRDGGLQPAGAGQQRRHRHRG